jgi:hypothetical protein
MMKDTFYARWNNVVWSLGVQHHIQLYHDISYSKMDKKLLMYLKDSDYPLNGAGTASHAYEHLLTTGPRLFIYYRGLRCLMKDTSHPQSRHRGYCTQGTGASIAAMLREHGIPFKWDGTPGDAITITVQEVLQP